MFKNIGKSIRILSIVLAVLCFLGFAALGALFLLSAMEAGISEDLKTAGLQAAVICFVLCILMPCLNLALYGFGTLITAVQSQAQDSQKIKEMLQSALSDGMLSEEIARKSGQAQAKLLTQLMANMPAPTAAPKKAPRAPIQRPVKEIATAPLATPEPPRTPTPVTPVQEAPTLTEQFPTMQEAVPLAAPATPVASASVLKPLSGDEETF